MNSFIKNTRTGRVFPAIAALALIFSVLAANVSPVVFAGQLENGTLEIKSTTPAEYEIGDEGPGGGLIFHIDGNTHYEAAPEGWNIGNDPSIQWGCRGQSVPGANGTGIGDGVANTQAIVDFHDNPGNFGGEDYYTFAGDYEDIGCHTSNNGQVTAKIVNELELNDVDDWFLPSQDELAQMYQNLHLADLGGFSSATYWSSSGVSADFANSQGFSSGNQFTNGKSNTNRVRPIQAFTHVPNSSIHQFAFDIATTSNIGAFRFEYCVENPFPGEPCTAPSDLDVSSFSVDSQTGASGFSKDETNTTTNEIVVHNPSLQSFSSGDPITFDFGNIIDPNDPDQTFFVRIYSYSGDDASSDSIVDDVGLLVFSAAEISNLDPPDAMEIQLDSNNEVTFTADVSGFSDVGGGFVQLALLNADDAALGVFKDSRSGNGVSQDGDQFSATFNKAEFDQLNTDEYHFRVQVRYENSPGIVIAEQTSTGLTLGAVDGATPGDEDNVVGLPDTGVGVQLSGSSSSGISSTLLVSLLAVSLALLGSGTYLYRRFDY